MPGSVEDVKEGVREVITLKAALGLSGKSSRALAFTGASLWALQSISGSELWALWAYNNPEVHRIWEIEQVY